MQNALERKKLDAGNIIARVGTIKGARVLHDDPLVFQVDGFVDTKTCAHIRRVAHGKMQRAHVSGDKAGFVSPGRTNSVAWMDHGQDDILFALANRLCAMLDVPLSHAENYQIIHYGPGAEYRAHFDAFDAGTQRGERNMKNAGQRIATVLCYLNDVTEGGGTYFPKLDVRVRARAGRLVVFANCAPGTTQKHPLSLHAGEPVIAGEKWAFNLWLRQWPKTQTKAG